MFFHRINDRHSLRQLSVRDAEELFSVLDASRDQDDEDAKLCAVAVGGGK